jgi:23S rRNA pseudouridine1911/1915/1917 synthase
MHSLTVPDDAAGGRLDRFLASLEEVGSRAAAERLVETGAVTVDGQARPKSYKLAAGQTVAFPAPEHDPHAAGQDSGRCCSRGDVRPNPASRVSPAPGRGPTLVRPAAQIGEAGPGIVHRLDRDTSGFGGGARRPHPGAAAVALRGDTSTAAHGAGARPPRPRSGRIEAPIGRDRRDPTRVSLDSDVAKAAITHFTIAELCEGRTLRAVLRQYAVEHLRFLDRARRDDVDRHAVRRELERPGARQAEQCPHRRGEEIDVASPLPPDPGGCAGAGAGRAVRAEPGFR